METPPGLPFTSPTSLGLPRGSAGQPLPQVSVILYEQKHRKTLWPRSCGGGSGGGMGGALHSVLSLLALPPPPRPCPPMQPRSRHQATLFTHRDPVHFSEAAPGGQDAHTTPGPTACTEDSLDVAQEAEPLWACAGGASHRREPSLQ